MRTSTIILAVPILLTPAVAFAQARSMYVGTNGCEWFSSGIETCPVVEDENLAIGYGSSIVINFLTVYGAVQDPSLGTAITAQACWTSFANSYYYQCGQADSTGHGSALNPPVNVWQNDTYPDYPFVLLTGIYTDGLQGVSGIYYGH